MIKNLYEFIFTEKMIGDYEQSRSTGLNLGRFNTNPGFLQNVKFGDQEDQEHKQPEQQNE